MRYSGIFIIYNPKSTGDSEAMASELQSALTKKMGGVEVKTIPTEHAGHAEEIAQKIASNEKTPLVISSSGDGGYNEVVNGVMKAHNPDAICAVLAAGNANDHSRTMQDKPLAKTIVAADVTKLDLLRVTVDNGKGGSTVRYAHSYVGLGLTPVIATELNRHTLNAFREALIVFKTFVKYRPFKIRHEGRVIKLDSLLFGNINKMAKVLTIAPKNKPMDGKFEVILFPAGRKWRLVKRLAEAATSHLENVSRAQSYEFVTIKKMPMQMDGEVMLLHKGSRVLVESAQKALRTII